MSGWPQLVTWAWLAAAPDAPVMEQRYDHRGAIGVWVAGGGGAREGTDRSQHLDGGARFPLDVGASVALPDTQNAVWAEGRVAFGGPALEWSVRGGYRGYFGEDRWKTFLDLGLAFQITPRFAVGPRVGLGVIWEFSPVGGIFGEAGVEVGGGNGFHFAADGVVGIELRTFLLE